MSSVEHPEWHAATHSIRMLSSQPLGKSILTSFQGCCCRVFKETVVHAVLFFFFFLKLLAVLVCSDDNRTDKLCRRQIVDPTAEIGAQLI